LALFILFLFFVFFIPTLLSTSVGKNFVLSQVNDHLNGGKISADAISLGWFSGASVHGLKYIDASGKTVATADAIDTGLTGWQALTRTIPLKKCTISNVRIPDEFDIAHAEIPYHMDAGILTIDPADLPFTGGGRIRVRGKLDLNAAHPTFIIDSPDPSDTPFIKDLPLNQKIASGKLRFFPLFWGSIDQEGNVASVSGNVNIHLNSVNMPLNAEAFNTTATLYGSLNVKDLTTEAGLFSEIGKILGPIHLNKTPFAIKGGNIPDVTFALENGKVTYQDLRLGAPVANLTFSGSVGLDNSLAMNMQVGLAGVGVPVPIAIKGTTAHPQLTLSGKLPAINPENIGKSLQGAPKSLENLFEKKK